MHAAELRVLTVPRRYTGSVILYVLYLDLYTAPAGRGPRARVFLKKNVGWLGAGVVPLLRLGRLGAGGVPLLRPVWLGCLAQ
eukprot:SAG22_NODE_570_length_9013_cov_4.251739_10_plen_81_part_01